MPAFLNRQSILRALPLLGYAIFFAWYTNLSGPISTEEADEFLGKIRFANASPVVVAHWEHFLKTDDGGQFFMVNISENRDKPLQVGAMSAGESQQETMLRYAKFMLPRLLARACFPIFMGSSAGDAMDLVGIDQAGIRKWDSTAIMRYRSRRDLLEIAKELSADGSHKYKVAALSKTLAVPVTTSAFVFEPRVLLALVAIIGWLLLRGPRRS